MAQPRALILTGYGINCDDETAFAFNYAGASSDIVHINDLIDNPSILKKYQVFSFPGGFSYGDDTGSGKALATKIRLNLLDELQEFIERDTLMLGICNGFQVMVNLGIVPHEEDDTDRYKVSVSLQHNITNQYQCRWVNLVVNKDSNCVFTRNIDQLHIPVAHGEGNFYGPEEKLGIIEENNRITMRYALENGKPAQGKFPENPNGSVHDIASICDSTGRIMGMMPHPERALFFHHIEDWTLRKEELLRSGKDVSESADGMKIFTNAVEYFK